MKQTTAKTWDEFKSAINGFRAQYGRHERDLGGGKIYKRKNRLLFRGQSDAAWSLQTTLERTATAPFTVLRYMEHSVRGVHEIESFSGQKWNTKTYPELEEEIAKTQDAFRLCLPEYAYLVYLRHHGFPSPLLDWSESPFVAAFFAFAEARVSEEVAIYCYVETPEGSKGGWGGQAAIYLRGPYVTTDKRHFSQRAWYTVATMWDAGKKQHTFTAHEDVFKNGTDHQDVLLKIILPSQLRSSVLAELADYNINYFTLFHSEDALVRAIGMKSFELEDV
jgi:hypothetical protein